MGRINPLEASRKSLRVAKGKTSKDYPKTEGINQSEIERRKSAGERYRCAWPSDRKGAHKVKDCTRAIKLGKGTASYPTGKEYLKQESPCSGISSSGITEDKDSSNEE
jgi:hypothetical protein